LISEALEKNEDVGDKAKNRRKVMARTKKVFISDIHMSDERSMNARNPYCWFKKNIPVLEGFLDEQLQSTDVKEVVILGDLFETWVVPTNHEPLTSFVNICSNTANKPVIDKLKALAAHSEIKLAYVPGNHDMG
jgi:UDP-2,3-diacylglucosamine pyrophosphatase LpxH